MTLSSRAIALAALHRWRSSRLFADTIIQQLLASTESTSADRAFAQELFYGVLRNLTLLDFWIGALRKRKLDAQARDILRLGLYQIFILDTAEHAAVFETVAIAPKPQRRVVNAILRSALRRRAELVELSRAQPLAVQASHPDWLLERWRKQFGDEATLDLSCWNNRAAPIYVRVNRLRTTTSQFIRTYPGASTLPRSEDFVHLAEIPREALIRGECYIQDPSTALACRLLDARAGETILDACAAPGGKTAYICQLMANRGVVVACDRDEERLGILRENLHRLGVEIARSVQHDWTRGSVQSAIAECAPFDRILLDAPCGNTGVMRRRIDVRWRLRPDDFERMQERQLAIARNVLPLLKSGGVFVYSTCSLEQEENEAVVEQIAREFPQLKLERTESVLPFSDDFDGAFGARFVLCSGSRNLH